MGKHFIKQCRSLQRCKHCQRSHHTLLHIEPPTNTIPTTAGLNAAPGNSTPEVPSHAAIKLKSSSLLMTCRVVVTSPQGHSVEARALLDSASSASFVSECLIQSLHLPRAHQSIRVTGIAGSFPKSPIQSITTFQVSATHCQGRKFNLTAIVVPKVTCDLPITSIPFDLTWNHISDVPLADPTFGQPGHIDILLGVDIFADVLLQGRRTGPPGSPVALETKFGWVLSGSTGSTNSLDQINL